MAGAIPRIQGINDYINNPEKRQKESIQSNWKFLDVSPNSTTRIRVSWKMPRVKITDPKLDFNLKIKTTHHEGIVIPIVSSYSEVVIDIN